MRLMLILQCILGFQSQSIDFIDDFAQTNIPSGETISIELPREFQEWWRTRWCSPIAQRATMRLMFILQCILGLKSQSIDFTDAFAQADITSVETILIELPREFQELWRTIWCCSQIKENPIWSSRSRTPMIWKVAKLFVIARLCDEQGGSLPVHV